MPYKHKTFVSFDGDSVGFYYDLMTDWEQSDHLPFNLYNAQDLYSAFDSRAEESIKAQLAERMKESESFIILISESTRKLYSFVGWEVEQAIKREIPIIAVNLNGKRFMDQYRCPPVLASALVMHVGFNAEILEHALENWPESDRAFRAQKKSGPYYYNDEIYTTRTEASLNVDILNGIDPC